MCEPTTIAAVTAAVATVAQGYTQRQQGIHQNEVSKYNERQLDNEATRVRNLGVEQENKQREATAQLQARQRAQLAAQGVDLESGSAELIQEDTRVLGEADALRIRSNFEDRAVSLGQQGDLVRAGGKAAASAGKFNFGVSLLKAGASLGGAYASQWYSANSAANTVGAANNLAADAAFAPGNTAFAGGALPTF
ncbi:virion core protein, T7 gp14 family [Porticoccus sp.]